MPVESSKWWAIGESLWHPFETIAPEKSPLGELFALRSKGASVWYD